MIPQIYFEKIKKYFKGDIKKTWVWFKLPNPALGNVSPIQMLRSGRTDKLIKFIDYAVKGDNEL